MSPIRNLHARSASLVTSSCRVCGCSDVHLDQVQDGSSRLELGECPRCSHRWTRLLGSMRSIASVASASRAHWPSERSAAA
jgi:hypothetical protein